MLATKMILYCFSLWVLYSSPQILWEENTRLWSTVLTCGVCVCGRIPGKWLHYMFPVTWRSPNCVAWGWVTWSNLLVRSWNIYAGSSKFSVLRHRKVSITQPKRYKNIVVLSKYKHLDHDPDPNRYEKVMHHCISPPPNLQRLGCMA